jgi:halogenation protein CepH
VRLVAGLSALDEPVFGEGQEFFDSRIGFGEWFEGRIQRGTGSEPKPRTILPNGGGKFDTDKFMEGFTSEIAQIQLQALIGKGRSAEQPLFTSNLVPSSDGLHWIVASNKR